MTIDPQHHTPAPLTESEASAEASRLIREAYTPAPVPTPTSFRHPIPAPLAPAIGSTPHVPQPDSRRVPQWATGIAVASLGIGAGVTGIGCGIWLVLDGLSSLTLLGVLGMAAPFAGIATVATAIGAAISKARRASTTNIYQGTVIKRTEVKARGIGSRVRIGDDR